MNTIFTQKLPYLSIFCFFCLLQLVTSQQAFSQGSTVPVYAVDLTGNPNGIWTSPEVGRNGKTCGATETDNCIQFNITLDKNSAGLEFSIIDGPVPQGAMAYQVDCGPATPVGDPICVSGTGPHSLTICMPGNAKNVFRVNAIAAFTPVPDVSVSGSCSIQLQAPTAFHGATVSWQDITGAGAYNKYLSCVSGCPNPTLTPDSNPPSYVDYVVCGQSAVSSCSTLPFCDTVRVTFNPGPAVSLQSTPAILCMGSTASITASVSGATGPISYLWNTGETTATLTNKPAGTYTVQVSQGIGCSIQKSITIAEVAGPSSITYTMKRSTCGASNGELNISSVTGGNLPFTYSKDGINFQAATTFTGLKAGQYNITAKDVNGCQVTIQALVEDTAGPTDLILKTHSASCDNSNGWVDVIGVTGGTEPYMYAREGGPFQSFQTFGSLKKGVYKVFVKDANGCIYSESFTIEDPGAPTNFNETVKASTCGNSNGQITINTVSGGTNPYTYSLNNSPYQKSASFTSLAAGEYQISVKDARGCIITRRVTVNNLAGPSEVFATVKASTCGNSNGVLTITGVNSGTGPYTYRLNNGSFQASPSFSALAADSYTLTVTDANGCTFTKSFTVTNLEGPSTFLATSKVSTCGHANGEITIGEITGGTAPYTYSKNGTTFQPSATFSTLTSGTYSITVKDANGCLVSREIVVDGIDGPTDVSLIIASSTCGKNNGSISISGVTGGVPPYTYALNTGTYQGATTFPALVSGEYKVLVKDATGCTFIKSILVGDITGPSNFTATTKITTCGNSNGELTITQVTGGIEPYTYSKDGVNFQASATFQNLSAGSHRMTVKDANGCTFLQTVTISNTAGPTAIAATPTAASCADNDGSITVSGVTGGTAPYTYSIDDKRFETSSTFGSLASGTYTLTVKDANGCEVSSTVTINQNIPTAFSNTLAASTCGNSNGSILIGTVTGGTAPYTFSRDGVNFQTSPTFQALAAGYYTITVKDAKGCTVSKSLSIGNTDGPSDLIASAKTSFCGGNNGEVTINSVIGGLPPYTYSLNESSFQASAKFSGLVPGTYLIAVKDAAGCVMNKTQEVVNSGGIESFAFTSTETSCGNTNGKISIGQIKGGQSPYVYSLDGTHFLSASEFTNLAEGDHRVTVKDARGCLLTQSVVVGSTQPITHVKFSVTHGSCDQATGQVVIEEVTGGLAPYTYSLNGSSFSSTSSFTGVAPGHYQLTVKDARNCTYSVPVRMQKQVAQLAYVKHVTCLGEANGSLAITTQGKDANTEFSINNGRSFQKDSVFTNLPAGVYQVVVRFSANCSKWVDKAEVKAPTPVQIAITPVTSTSAAVTAIFGGTAPYVYQLDNGTFSQDTVFTNLTAGKHTLLVKDQNGCISEASFSMEALADGQSFEIPTGFTPNGDGINDVWVLKNMHALYPNCKVTVYNRWGSQVFESRGYKKAWDGTYQGKDLPTGTYYVLVDLGNGEPVLKKSLTIMR